MKDHITIRIESPAFEPDAVRVAELTGTESIARLFELSGRRISSAPIGPAPICAGPTSTPPRRGRPS